MPGAGTAPGASPRLRLAYLTNQYPAVSHTFIRREIREMERRGHSVARFSIRKADHGPVDPEDLDEVGRTTTVLAQPPIKLLVSTLGMLASRPGRFLRAARQMLRMSRKSDRGIVTHVAYLVEAAYLVHELRRLNVQHVHVHFATNAAAVMRLAYLLGGPTYSLMVHGSIEWEEPRQLDIGGKIADARFVAAISHFTIGQCRRWSSPTDWGKMHLVRCTIGDGYQATQPTRINPENQTLVCVGRISAEKGQTLLVEAFAEAINSPGAERARLVLVGDGDMRAFVQDRARALGIAERVEITGWVPESTVRERIAGARALVLTSYMEGLPVVVMEALALGRPVVVSAVGAIPELVAHGRNGWLFPAGDAVTLTATLREVLAAPADRLEAMGQAGRADVLERHSAKTECDKLERLFQQYVSAAAAQTGGG